MSKKTGRHKQKKSFPWILLVFGGVLIIAAIFIFAKHGSADAGGTPAIAVDQQKIDYGYVQFDNNKTFTIKVTNNGTGELRFKEDPYIEVLEGC